MPLFRPLFTVRRMMMAVIVSALAVDLIRWFVTDFIQPRRYRYVGDKLISSRRLTSKEFEASGHAKPWYFVEPRPPGRK